MRILLVEDDPMVSAAILGSLQDDGYAVDCVADGGTAALSAQTHSYDLVLLDLGLPDQEGTAVLARLRQHQPDLPVIVVTARDEVSERVHSLDAGADDYILKPFDTSELKARMRAVLRRHRVGPVETVLRCGRIGIDVARHVVHIEDGDTITLPRREFAVLRAMASRPGVIMSREEIEHRVYGWGNEVESNAVEYAIHGIRAKLGADTIRNIRGVGWMVPGDPTS